MPLQPPEYVFTRTRLENGQTEIRIVTRSTSDPDVDLHGADARKETSRWLLSIASGLATACGMTELQESFYLIHAAVVDNVDQETILRTIRKKRCTPESLASDPPDGMDPEILRILLADLMDSDMVYLDGHLKCTGDN